MNTNLKSRHKATAVIICLMVHCMLLLGIIIMELHDPEHEPIIMIADMQQDDPHHPITQEQWVAMNNSLPNAQFMHAGDHAQPEQEKAVPAPQETPTIPQLEPNELAHDQPQKQEPSLIEDSLDEVLELATQFMQERAPEKEKMEKIELSKPKQIQPLPPQQAQEQKTITLAQIAQGFMSQIQESPMKVDSDAQGQASMNQLQQLHYCQKIISCIVNSYKINRFNAPATQQDNRLCIHLALKQDGTIHTLRLVQSSGNASLDQFVLAMFKDASSSFPPLPQSFKQLPFHLPFFNVDRIESFQTTQGWYIDNRQS